MDHRRREKRAAPPNGERGDRYDFPTGIYNILLDIFIFEIPNINQACIDMYISTVYIYWYIYILETEREVYIVQRNLLENRRVAENLPDMRSHTDCFGVWSVARRAIEVHHSGGNKNDPCYYTSSVGA